MGRTTFNPLSNLALREERALPPPPTGHAAGRRRGHWQRPRRRRGVVRCGGQRAGTFRRRQRRGLVPRCRPGRGSHPGRTTRSGRPAYRRALRSGSPDAGSVALADGRRHARRQRLVRHADPALAWPTRSRRSSSTPAATCTRARSTCAGNRSLTSTSPGPRRPMRITPPSPLTVSTCSTARPRLRQRIVTTKHSSTHAPCLRM